MGVTENITLARLHSLHLEENFGVRHFSGTITYLYSLSINSIYLQDNICLRLDLGRVEVLAEVLVNGNALVFVGLLLMVLTYSSYCAKEII